MGISLTVTIEIVAICAVITLLERALPFLAFRNREVPAAVKYLGTVLPMAIMATLVVYCLKSIDIKDPVSIWPQLIAAVVTVILHLWKRNTLLSIFGGTLVCMVLSQVFMHI